jgi:murein L,D-transpeptidase YcbB/YkuD
MAKRVGTRYLRVIKKAKEQLSVKLDEGEILDRARKAASIQRQIQELESEEEQAKAQATSKKKQAERLDQDRRRLEFAVHQGSEEREVEVAHEADMRTGVVQEVRLDTREVLRERRMTSEESQGVMFSDMAAGPDDQGTEPIDLNPPKALPPAPRRNRKDGEANA